ncbi:MAG: TolB family protein, partial [Planctomycetota bacterium]
MIGRAVAIGVCLWAAAAGRVGAVDGAASAKGPGLIVFSSDRSGTWRIWTVRPDGSQIRELTEGKPDEHDVDPLFSPDGKLVLFSSTRGGSTGIWRMQADGSGLKRICDGDQAEWSPRGKSIVLRRKEAIFVRELST